jgi:DNA-binding GntR family transcriptional regulator
MNMPQLHAAEYQALGASVTRTLRDAILAGVLEPGAHLVESAIAEQMGVSRGPVRDAIQELEEQGLVVNIPRRGAYVVEWSAVDIQEVYTLRMMLEGLAARLAAVRITPEQCKELELLIKEMERGCTIEESIQLDLRFHELLCAAAHHSRLQKALADMHTQVELSIAWTRPPRDVWAGPKGMVREHSDILNAVRSGNPDLAERVMRGSIEESGRRLMEKLAKDKAVALVPDVGQNE